MKVRVFAAMLTLVAALCATTVPSAAQEAVASRSVPTVNINTASQDQFEALPGVGAKTAQRILEHRQKNGPFKKVEELMNIKGIGEKSFLKLKPYLTVGAPKADKPAPGAMD